MASTPFYVDPSLALMARLRSGHRSLVTPNGTSSGAVPASRSTGLSFRARSVERGDGCAPETSSYVDPTHRAYFGHPPFGATLCGSGGSHTGFTGFAQHRQGGVEDPQGVGPGPLERETVQLVRDLDHTAGVD